MRIFFVDNGLRTLQGHHFILALGFQEEARRLGIDLRFYVHAKATEDVWGPLNARRVFPHDPYSQVSRDGLAEPIEGMLSRGPDFAQALTSLLSDGLSSDDLVLHPSVLHTELFGWSGWLRGTPSEKVPHIFLNACMDWCTNQITGEASPGHQVAYRVAGRALACAPNGSRRVALTTHDPDYATQVEYLTSHRTLVFPHFQRYGPERERTANGRRRETGAPLRVCMLGQTRKEKGFDLLPEIVARTDQQPGKLSYLIQVTPPSAVKLWEDRAEETTARSSVEMLYGLAGPEDHLRLLERTEILLLPYDPRLYKGRSSNLFGDAVSQAIVSIVPADTWMAKKIEAGAASGVIYREHSAESVAAALFEAEARFAELQEKANACSGPWRRTESIAAYLDRALSVVEERKPASMRRPASA